MTGPVRILVIDDEPAIHRFLRPALEANEYEAVSAGTGAEGLKRIAADAPDVVVLDLGLPDLEAEKITALDLGADDFVNKPFGMGELMARLRTALRHRMQRKGETPVVSVGGLEIDVPRRRVVLEGVEVSLSPKEFDLLAFLAGHAGKVVTHKQILTAVWGAAHENDTQYLRVYIGQLRQKIEPNPSDPRFILTEPGIGYRMLDAV